MKLKTQIPNTSTMPKYQIQIPNACYFCHKNCFRLLQWATKTRATLHTGDSNTKSDIQCDSDTKWMLIKSNIYRRFMCEFKNGRKTCISVFDAKLVVSRNHGTSTMHNHVKFCEKKSQKSVATSQSVLTFTSTDGKFKHLIDVAKLVYQDKIPISEVVRSATLQMFYWRLGITGVAIDSVTNCLEEEYQSVVSGIKQLLHSRDRKELMCLSFDKCFIGVYLFACGKKLCFGMLKYVGFCGSEEIAVKLTSI